MMPSNDRPIVASPPLLSIITVSYNSLEGLKKTNASLNLPEGIAVETLLIDGLSTDGTAEFMADSRCRYSVRVREKDSGIYDAMNKGIALARGRYLLFLNCGDRLAGALPWAELVRDLSGAEAVLMGHLALDNGGRAEIREGHFRIETFVRHAWPHQASFIPREFFRELGDYDKSIRVSADQEWFVRALAAGKPFRALGYDIAVYAGGGVSERPDNERVIAAERRDILHRHLGRFGALLLVGRVTVREAVLTGLRNLKAILRGRS